MKASIAEVRAAAVTSLVVLLALDPGPSLWWAGRWEVYEAGRAWSDRLWFGGES